MRRFSGESLILRIMQINAEDPDNSAHHPAKGLLEEQLTGQVIGAFFAVYNDLRFGLLESAYAGALEVEFEERAVPFVRELPINVYYHGRVVGTYRADFVIAGRVIVEVKAARALGDPDRRQLLHYLRATGIEVGLLLNFGHEATFHRMVYTK
jgi:GxxExxY protein